jgi:cytochrome c oxidase subunit 2
MTRRVAILTCLLSSAIVSSPASGDAAPQATEPRVIEVVARRYAFEPSQIDVTKGERIRILVTSGDGLHGFEIKKFKVSKEIPRGSAPVVIEFTANEAGRFPILCSTFCGDGHEDMKGMLVVQARTAALR